MWCWAMFTKPAGFQPLRPSSHLSLVESAGLTNLRYLSTSPGRCGSAGWQKFLPAWCSCWPRFELPLTAQTGFRCEGPSCPLGLSANICSPKIFNSSRLPPQWGWWCWSRSVWKGPVAASMSLFPPLLGWWPRAARWWRSPGKRKGPD